MPNVKPHFHDDDTGLGFESLLSLYVNKHPASDNRVTKFTRYSETTHYVGSKTAVNHSMALTLVNQHDMTCTLPLGTALTYHKEHMQ